MIDQQDLDFLFRGSVEDVDAFLIQHPDSFNDYLRKELSQEARGDDLAMTRTTIFSHVYGVTVDWREEDSEIVSLFGAYLPGEVDVTETEEGLSMIYEGEVHSIPLTFSQQDRYITIKAIAEIVHEQFEIRLFQESYYSDTHVLLLMPREQWGYIDEHYTAAAQEMFQKLTPELDFP